MREFKQLESLAQYLKRTGADPESFAADRIAALNAEKDRFIRPAVAADYARFLRLMNMPGAE
jgi:hypothetical protein